MSLERADATPRDARGALCGRDARGASRARTARRVDDVDADVRAVKNKNNNRVVM
jgi:hypothetical protein